MGAVDCNATIRAHSMSEAWKIAQEEAEEEHGHEQGYSGNLNCCEFEEDVTYKLRNMSPKKLEQWMYDNVEKREAYGYCKVKPKGNTNKTKSVVKNIPQKGTRKWETVYIAETMGWNGGMERVRASTQTECVKKARAWVEKNPDQSLSIRITKELTKGNIKCAEVSYKASKTESKGTYVFIGCAPY